MSGQHVPRGVSERNRKSARSTTGRRVTEHAAQFGNGKFLLFQRRPVVRNDRVASHKMTRKIERQMRYSRAVLLRVTPPTSCSNRRVQPPTVVRTRAPPCCFTLQKIHGGYTSRTQSEQHTRARAHFHGTTESRRRPSTRVKGDRDRFIPARRGDARPRKRACQSRDRRMAWRPQAQLSAYGALNATSPSRRERRLAAAAAFGQSRALSQNRAGRQSARLPPRAKIQPRKELRSGDVSERNLAGRNSSTGHSRRR